MITTEGLQKLGFESLVDYRLEADSGGVVFISEWNPDQPQPTEAEIETAHAEWQAEWDAQEYARNRQAEYPSTQDFMEAYTEKEIGGDSTKWDAYVIAYNKVRTDNPKP